MSAREYADYFWNRYPVPQRATLRRDAGLSLADVAFMCSVNPSTVAEWESGTASVPRAIAHRYALVFDACRTLLDAA